MRDRTVHRTRRAAALGVVLVLAACGGGDDDTEPAADPAADEATADDQEGDQAGDESTDVTDDGAGDMADDAGDDTYEPGPVSYRVVNFADQPVDLYVRTQGLVKAYEAEAGVAPGAVTGWYAPPADGAFVVTTAGADDPECVATCPHILVSLTAFESDGPVHTVVLYDEGDQVRAYDLWEDPVGESGNANAMPPADPATALFVVNAIDVTDADFGLRLGLAGTPGCVAPVGNANILVGGTSTPAFAFDGGSVDVSVYDNQDQECAGDPVGGPFTIAGGPGSRTHLVLTGSPGALEAAVVPFASSGDAPAPADGDAGGDEAASGDRDTAVALMSEELAAEMGLPADAAGCLAPYVIDAIGVEAALPGGELIDLDTADEATQNLAFDGIIAGVEACDIDPALLGG